MAREPQRGRVFSTAEVAKLGGISPSTVRRWVAKGLLHPGRGPRGHGFSWADLSRVRGWSSLSSVPVTCVVRALSRHANPSGVRIRAHGRSLALVDSEGLFDPGTGQSLLELDEPAGSVSAIRSDREWRVELDAARSDGNLERAQTIVESQLEVHPEDAVAWFECAALHHLRGALGSAAGAYERAAERACTDLRVRALFNLGVVYEDAAKDERAAQAYTDALAIAPGFADGHFNAARVWERLGDRWRALRHLHAFRRLQR